MVPEKITVYNHRIHLARLDYFWECLQTMVALPFSDQLSKHGNIIVVLLMLMTTEKTKTNFIVHV